MLVGARSIPRRERPTRPLGLAGWVSSSPSTRIGSDDMTRRGQAFDNAITGERAVILTDPDEHPERVLVAHLFVKPGGRVAAEHFHPTLTERFHILRGQVGFLIDGRERVLGAGESARIPVGARHDWWQMGN